LINESLTPLSQAAGNLKSIHLFILLGEIII